MMGWAKQAVMFVVCGNESLGSEPQSLHYYVPILRGVGERNRGYALLMTANTVYLLKIRQDKNNYCRVLLKQIEIKLQISHRNAKVPNN